MGVRSHRLPELNLGTSSSFKRDAIIHRTLDFWLLGGASLLVWLIGIFLSDIRESNMAVQRQIANLPYTFSALTILCNHPHFISSYKFGYGRGFKFIFRHWFSLLVVPAGLLGLFYFSYSSFETTAIDYETANTFMSYLPVGFTLGQRNDLGSEILGLCVWIMWLTVGWHYAKQVFGCVLIYAQYDNYKFAPKQRLILRVGLLAVAAVNLLYLGIKTSGQNYYHSLQVTPLNVAPYLLTTAYVVFGVFAAATAGVFVYNYIQAKARPSLNMLIPILAFYIWWLPEIWPIEYAMVFVPFFHSLQYLPFSYKMISSSAEAKFPRYSAVVISSQILAILVLGFLAFDVFPSILDQDLHTQINFGNPFFLICSAIFLNVHHFFIDSVVWKFHQSEVRQALLE